jgi:flagellar protein FlaJ
MAGIKPDRCWKQFVGESGSEQVNRSVRIFWDGVSLGGDPEKVGNEASAYAMKIAYLRSQRRLIASGLTWLAFAMHTVLAVVVVFIDQTLVTFSQLVKQTMPDGNVGTMVPGMSNLGIYAGNAREMNMLHFMVIIIIMVLTGANATAVYATDGGHINKLAFYLALTMILSGLALIFVPPVVNYLLVGMV